MAITNNKPWIVIGILHLHPELITSRSTFGETILMLALKRISNPELIEKLIELTPEEELTSKDVFGDTVLHMAVTFKSTRQAELLFMKSPCLLLIRNKSGDTPLMKAVKERSSSELVNKLIEFTSVEDLAMLDNLENTVLHMAAMVGNIELAKLLLIKCPRLLLIRNNLKFLPIHEAIKHGHTGMKDYLLTMAKQQGYNDSFAGVTSQDLLHSAINARMNDVIVALSYSNPDLLKFIRERDEPLPEVEDANSWVLKEIGPTSGETKIMLAATKGISFDSIKVMIENSSNEELAQTDYFGNTVLHTVAMLGDTQLANLLCTKNPAFLRIRNDSGDVPICIAIKNGDEEMADLLYKKAIDTKYDDPFFSAATADVLDSAIKAGMYDMALSLKRKYPTLSMEDSSNLQLWAGDPSSFPSTPFNIWNGTLVRILKSILRIDSRKFFNANVLLDQICRKAENQGYDKASSLFKEPFLLAAQNGIESIVRGILTHHPDAIHFVNEEGHSVFHLAVIYRHENIFNFAYKNYRVAVSKRLLSRTDNKGNNVLHLAGYTTPQNRVDQSTKVIFQMQREVKWFKELENLLYPQDIKEKNADKKTPLTIFNEEHKDLVTKEIQWMTRMASACSVAAPLIATVAFAAAITVPGGNDGNGLPMFSSHKSFIVFAVSDAIALFASINSVLSFLAIFTSQYEAHDFLYTLPKRLIIGLISLFISAISLMIAFGTTLFLVFCQKNFMILIPIITFSSAPVIQYAILQLPSLWNMIKSTYGQRILA